MLYLPPRLWEERPNEAERPEHRLHHWIFHLRRSPTIQLGATGQVPNPCIYSQLTWIRRAPDRPQIRKETGARDQSYRSEYWKVSPGGVVQKHGLPRLAAVFTCLSGAIHSFARQDRPWELEQSVLSCGLNLPRVGIWADLAERRLLLLLYRLAREGRRIWFFFTGNIL